MTKRFFYPLFRAAFHKAFTQKNIEHAFEKTGIWPHDPKQVLGKIRKPEPIPKPILINGTFKTLKTCRFSGMHCPIFGRRLPTICVNQKEIGKGQARNQRY